MLAYEFWMRLGDFVFDVKPQYYNTRHTCRDYLIPQDKEITPDTVITVTSEELEQEKNISPYSWVMDENVSQETVGAFLELSVVFRKIGDFLSYQNASVFHGVLLELNGEGYLFTARSGTGKSTHAMNWMKAFPGARIINGDKPILRMEGDRVMGYGTPWCGKEKFQLNEKVPVKAVILIERGNENIIERQSNMQMLSTWLMQTHCPSDPMAMERVVDTALQMMSRVSLFCLHCNMDVESALVARRGIEQENVKDEL